MTKKIKIPFGNDLPVSFKLAVKNLDGTITPIRTSEVQNLVVRYGSSSPAQARQIDYTSDENFIYVFLDSTILKRGAIYSFYISGYRNGLDFSLNFINVIEVVTDSDDANYLDFVIDMQQVEYGGFFIGLKNYDETIRPYIEEAERATENANTSAANANASEEERKGNERKRIEAENAREEAEQVRQTHEAVRVSAEEERKSTFDALKSSVMLFLSNSKSQWGAWFDSVKVAWSTWFTNTSGEWSSFYQQAQSQDAAIQQAESERAANEEARVSAEESRELAEEMRKTTFETNESDRTNTFNTNEATRENTFAENENRRDEVVASAVANINKLGLSVLDGKLCVTFNQ